VNTRAIAAQVVIRVRDEGAYSNIVLPQATSDLESADRAFVYSLVTGVLRHQRQVEEMIEAASSRPISELDPEVSAILEVAAAELLTDDKRVVYATVNESVDAIRDLGKPRAASFVNAILRRLARELDSGETPDPAVAWSVPDWVVERLQVDHGVEEASKILAGLRNPAPQIPIRVRPGRDVPEGATEVEGIASAYYLTARPTMKGLVIVDAASTAVGNAVAATPGQRVLDMAAAPGGKTIHLWDQIQPGGELVAMDFHKRRIRSARRRLDDLGIDPSWVRADGTQAPFCDASFDAVLVDAPCTGLGTLRRRPEIAMRLDSASPDRLADQQRALLAEAWRVARPGGRIVYSVCTVFAAETVDIVADYPSRAPAEVPGRVWVNGKLLAPHNTGTDGMFIAAIDR
jgi:16S rRNA (cytosine967-C5)-methyltransferase